MGIHILPRLVGERIKEKDFMTQTTRLRSKTYKDFDDCRHAGDRDFIFNDGAIEWDYIYHDPNDEDFENSFRRPKDINKAKEWVRGNIPPSNIPRLLSLLEAMEINKNLYIQVSY